MSKRVDITGKKFGLLTAIRFHEIRRQKSIWEFRCDCGAAHFTGSNIVQTGKAKSCGCLKLKQNNRSRWPEYSSWYGMLNRCSDPTNPKYAYYGGRGISVCERWKESFSNFLEDMGRKPDKKMSLDRINLNGNYEPGNCRWATVYQQMLNRSNNVRYAFRGKNLTVAEWSRITGFSVGMIRHRILRLKMPIEEVLTKPSRYKIKPARRRREGGLLGRKIPLEMQGEFATITEKAA